MPDDAELGTREVHQTAIGGEHVLIRRARPALYRDFLAGVSTEDLRLRFFANVGELSAEEMDKLRHLDYRHEMAFIALDEDTGDMLGLVRLKDELDEETAEFAILVRSRLKGHGLGWLLMRHVIECAKEKGLRRVYGDVSKTPPCCKCAPNSASTWLRTWHPTSGELRSISAAMSVSILVSFKEP